MILRLLPWLLMLAAFPASAETDLERADRLLEEADLLRTQAEERFRAAEPACYERILVNRCIDQANDARLRDVRRAREMETEAHRVKLADKQRRAAEAGRAAGQGPDGPAAPAATMEIRPDPAAEELRRQREASAARNEAAATAARREKDAAKAEERAKAEAEAAKRAEQANRDRARYEARIRKRQEEQAEDAAKSK